MSAIQNMNCPYKKDCGGCVSIGEAYADTLAEKDPDYFYRNLAYAFALGVTAAYAKRFAQMAMNDPDWYTSDIHHGGSGAARMADSVSSMANSIGSSMSSSPSSGSGGGSFSGGGGGGGSGGGSW